MSLYAILDDGRVVYGATRRELYDAYGQDRVVESGPASHPSDEALVLLARGDLAAIAALSVSALTLAIVPLTLDQLEALLLFEGRRVGGGRATALREISLAIDARAGR